MAFDLFPATPGPDYPIEVSRDIKIKRQRFNDGSEQRFPIGVNNDDRTVELTWTNVTVEEKDIIINFLNRKKGYLPFAWNRPGTAETLNYFSGKYKETQVNATYWKIAATLERVYDR